MTFSFVTFGIETKKKREGVKQVIMSQCPNYGSVFLDTFITIKQISDRLLPYTSAFEIIP